jgi:hypothetical protein
MTRRPWTSAKAPQILGDSPWKIRYEVTVRLISSDTDGSLAIVGIAGKYMFEERPENTAAVEMMATISAFWLGVKTL